MFIPDPDFIYPGSQIKQQQQMRRGKKFVVLAFDVATNITIPVPVLKIILFLNR
jgi:hypothetical protein